MPLTPEQIKILQTPATRSFRASFASDFAYFDNLISTVGPNCPRLPNVWLKIFPTNDEKVRNWFQSNFVGISYSPGGNKPQEPPKQNLNPIVRSSGIVNKAFNVLNSYRRKP